jgi:acetyltransferase
MAVPNRSAAPIVIRPLVPGDRDAYERAVAGLSEATYRLRFGTPRRSLTEAEITNFLDIGHDGRVALAAVQQSTGEIVGVARYVADSDSPGEVESAIVVADAWQGHGVGHQLLDALLADARTAGYGLVRATSLVENDHIAGMLRHRGFRQLSVNNGVSEWVADLGAGRLTTR